MEQKKLSFFIKNLFDEKEKQIDSREYKEERDLVISSLKKKLETGKSLTRIDKAIIQSELDAYENEFNVFKKAKKEWLNEKKYKWEYPEEIVQDVDIISKTDGLLMKFSGLFRVEELELFGDFLRNDFFWQTTKKESDFNFLKTNSKTGEDKQEYSFSKNGVNLSTKRNTALGDIVVRIFSERIDRFISYLLAVARNLKEIKKSNSSTTANVVYGRKYANNKDSDGELISYKNNAHMDFDRSMYYLTIGSERRLEIESGLKKKKVYQLMVGGATGSLLIFSPAAMKKYQFQITPSRDNLASTISFTFFTSKTVRGGEQIKKVQSGVREKKPKIDTGTVRIEALPKDINSVIENNIIDDNDNNYYRDDKKKEDVGDNDDDNMSDDPISKAILENLNKQNEKNVIHSTTPLSHQQGEVIPLKIDPKKRLLVIDNIILNGGDVDEEALKGYLKLNDLELDERTWEYAEFLSKMCNRVQFDKNFPIDESVDWKISGSKDKAKKEFDEQDLIGLLKDMVKKIKVNGFDMTLDERFEKVLSYTMNPYYKKAFLDLAEIEKEKGAMNEDEVIKFLDKRGIMYFDGESIFTDPIVRKSFYELVNQSPHHTPHRKEVESSLKIDPKKRLAVINNIIMNSGDVQEDALRGYFKLNALELDKQTWEYAEFLSKMCNTVPMDEGKFLTDESAYKKLSEYKDEALEKFNENNLVALIKDMIREINDTLFHMDLDKNFEKVLRYTMHPALKKAFLDLAEIEKEKGEIGEDEVIAFLDSRGFIYFNGESIYTDPDVRKNFYELVKKSPSSSSTSSSSPNKRPLSPQKQSNTTTTTTTNKIDPQKKEAVIEYLIINDDNENEGPLRGFLNLKGLELDQNTMKFEMLLSSAWHDIYGDDKFGKTQSYDEKQLSRYIIDAKEKFGEEHLIEIIRRLRRENIEFDVELSDDQEKVLKFTMHPALQKAFIELAELEKREGPMVKEEDEIAFFQKRGIVSYGGSSGESIWYDPAIRASFLELVKNSPSSTSSPNKRKTSNKNTSRQSLLKGKKVNWKNTKDNKSSTTTAHNIDAIVEEYDKKKLLIHCILDKEKSKLSSRTIPQLEQLILNLHLRESKN